MNGPSWKDRPDVPGDYIIQAKPERTYDYGARRTICIIDEDALPFDGPDPVWRWYGPIPEDPEVNPSSPKEVKS